MTRCMCGCRFPAGSTSTLQTVYDYGGVIWEGESFEPSSRAAKVEGLAEELNALRMNFLVNERAMFEFNDSGNRRCLRRCRGSGTRARFFISQR